jgi:hypothetical protein
MSKPWTITIDPNARKLVVVFARKEGRFWNLRVKGRDDINSQAVSLAQAETIIRELIGEIDGVAPDSFGVQVIPKLDVDVEDALQALDVVQAIESNGTALRRGLAVALVRERGLSMRDAARVLGISHQRVDQLIAEHDQWGGEERPPFSEYLKHIDAVVDRKDFFIFRVGDDATEGLAKLAKLIEQRSADPAS